MRRFMNAALGAVLTVGCAASMIGCGDASRTASYRYTCEDDVFFVATIAADGEKAIVVLDGEEHELGRVLSGSGVKYSDGSMVYWAKGDEAFIEIDGEIVHRDCYKLAPPEA